MSPPNRANVVAQLEEWVNKRIWPWVTRRFRFEARTFVRKETAPTPRADDGANDDSILAWGVALALYAKYGKGYKFDRKKETAKVIRRLTDPLDPRRKKR